MLIGRKRKFIFEFKRLSLVLPYHSKSSIVTVVTGGRGTGIQPRTFACQAHVVPLTTSPACKHHSTELCHWPFSVLVWSWGWITSMHGDYIIAHCQWPTPPPANPAHYLPSHSVLPLLLLGSKLRVLLAYPARQALYLSTTSPAFYPWQCR